MTLMNVTVNLSAAEMAQIKLLTAITNEGDALTKAAREFLRISQLRELKGTSGNVDYTDASETMEALELREGNLHE